MNPVRLACAAINSNFSELARRVGVRPQAVQQWAALGRVPAKRARKVAEVTGLPLHVLNPDVFPDDSKAA